MIIGFDLDNTIVDCRVAFANAASNILGFSVHNLTREQIRSEIRLKFNDAVWTELQSDVYGEQYKFCRPYVGSLDCISRISKLPKVNDIVIVSHKTKTDSAGRGIELRKHARSWVYRNLVTSSIIKECNVYFCETVDEKITKIKELKCSIFFDDLEHIVSKLNSIINLPILFEEELKIEQRKLNNKFISSSWGDLYELVLKYDNH